jgi:hypothetical protein
VAVVEPCPSTDTELPLTVTGIDTDRSTPLRGALLTDDADPLAVVLVAEASAPFGAAGAALAELCPSTETALPVTCTGAAIGAETTVPPCVPDVPSAEAMPAPMAQSPPTKSVPCRQRFTT